MPPIVLTYAPVICETLGNAKHLNSVGRMVPLLYQDIHWPEEGAVSLGKRLRLPPRNAQGHSLLEKVSLSTQLALHSLPVSGYILYDFLFKITFSVSL